MSIGRLRIKFLEGKTKTIRNPAPKPLQLPHAKGVSGGVMKAIELFELNIKRVSALLDVHKRTYPKGRPVAEGEAADLLRAVIVFEIAALDAYVHKKVMEVVTKIIQDKKRIPEKCVDLITKQFKESDRSRHLLNIAIHDRPERQILKLFEKSLSLQTFQKPEQIQNAFEMMEIKEGWGQIKRSMQPKKGRRKKGERI